MCHIQKLVWVYEHAYLAVSGRKRVSEHMLAQTVRTKSIIMIVRKTAQRDRSIKQHDYTPVIVLNALNGGVLYNASAQYVRYVSRMSITEYAGRRTAHSL